MKINSWPRWRRWLGMMLLPVVGACASAPQEANIEPAAEPASTAEGVEPEPIYKSDEPITIDGVLDEPVWHEAIPIVANFDYTQLGQRDDQPRMIARFAWDEHYLYIGYEVFDTHLVALTDDRMKGPPDNRRHAALPFDPQRQADVAEFLITLGDQRFLWEIHHNARNDFNEIFMNVLDPDWPIAQSSLDTLNADLILNQQEYIGDDGPRKLRTAAQLKPKADGTPTTLNDPSDTDTGYIGEIRLPWTGLGAPLEARASAQAKGMEPGAWDMAGRTVRILSVVLDGKMDEHYLYYHSSPTRPPRSLFAKGAKYFPRYVLID